MRYIIAVLMILLPFRVWAACSGSSPTLTAASCNTSDINDCISASSSGDTINVPSGTCTWSSRVTIPGNKVLSFIGAGAGQTIIYPTNGAFYKYDSAGQDAYAKFRISGFTFTGSTLNLFLLEVDQYGPSSIPASATDVWRFDHNQVDFTGSVSDLIVTAGTHWGLIDNNTFNKTIGTFILVTGYQYGYEYDNNQIRGTFDNSLPLDLGTFKAVVIEDNTFTCGDGSGYCSFIDVSNGGGRYTFRHNSVTGGQIYTHWTRNGGHGGGETGAIKFEVYGNDIVGTAGVTTVARFESGTGVFINNRVRSFSDTSVVLDDRRASIFFDGDASETPIFYACDGLQPYDGNLGDASAPGWPCLNQIGRGSGAASLTSPQPSVPLFINHNGPEATCTTPGGTCTDISGVKIWFDDTLATQTSAPFIKSTPHTVIGGGTGQGDVDYCLMDPTTVTSGNKCGNYGTTYTPYTYPHPLNTGGSMTGKSAPWSR